MGNYLLEALRSNLNPLQVVDLHNTGPRAALKLFAKVPNVRILVAGGDARWRGFCRRSTKSTFEKTTRGHLTSGNRKRSRESFGMGRWVLQRTHLRALGASRRGAHRVARSLAGGDRPQRAAQDSQ